MGFLYPKDLRRHLPTHNDPSLVVAIKHYCPYPGCDNLDGFSRKDNLLRHQRKHLRSTHATHVQFRQDRRYNNNPLYKVQPAPLRVTARRLIACNLFRYRVNALSLE
ncbi:hypothetical protein IG631_00816 [Alternaria alternata]|nr:hypothetical protein IG631_00816 [Alternaria alternata]